MSVVVSVVRRRLAELLASGDADLWGRWVRAISAALCMPQMLGATETDGLGITFIHNRSRGAAGAVLRGSPGAFSSLR